MKLKYSINKKEYYDYIDMNKVYSLHINNYNLNRNCIESINSLYDICYLYVILCLILEPRANLTVLLYIIQILKIIVTIFKVKKRITSLVIMYLIKIMLKIYYEFQDLILIYLLLNLFCL